MSRGNSSHATLQAAQSLIAEVLAAGSDPIEVAQYQTVVQACVREEESKHRQKLDKQQAELERQQAEEAERKRQADEKKRAEEAEEKRLADERERKRLVEIIESKRHAEELERKQQEELERKKADEAEQARKVAEEKLAAQKKAESSKCLNLLIDELEDNKGHGSHSGSQLVPKRTGPFLSSPSVRGSLKSGDQSPSIGPSYPSPSSLAASPRDSLRNELEREEKFRDDRSDSFRDDRNSFASLPPGAAPAGLPTYGEALSTLPPPGLPTYEESLNEPPRRLSESNIFENMNERESSVASFSHRSEGSIIPSLAGRVIYEGYMAKKSGGGIPLLRHWQKRYFVLCSPNKLHYFTDATKKEPRGMVPLDCVENLFAKQLRITLVMEPVEKKGKMKQRKFHLTAPTAAEAGRWIKAFETSFKEIDELEDHEGKVD